MEDHLLIFGASARAAAFSALRAGLRPWCADLFADADLQACCPVVRVPVKQYPQNFQQIIQQAPPGPWMYTGGMENRPALVRELTRLRPLWGNGVLVLQKARLPQFLDTLLRTYDVPCPQIVTAASRVPRRGRWLIKPRAGAGGTGIRFWQGKAPPAAKRKEVYYQEFIEGDAIAATYLGDGRTARLLGVTRQLVGEPCLHAAPFHYCASIGPLHPEPALRDALQRLGDVLVNGCRLRGLFGVDAVLHNGVPYPVEVNPRYTASVEVLEYATGLPALALHRRVFDTNAPEPPPPRPAGKVIGKAILFAPEALVFPDEGPWTLPTADTAVAHLLRLLMPAFADIPQAGERIPKGRPVLTFFAEADSLPECHDALRRTAGELDRRLFRA